MRDKNLGFFFLAYHMPRRLITTNYESK